MGVVGLIFEFLSHTLKFFKNYISFRDLQMILLPFLKISSHIKLRKMPLSSGIQGHDPWFNLSWLILNYPNPPSYPRDLQPGFSKLVYQEYILKAISRFCPSASSASASYYYLLLERCSARLGRLKNRLTQPKRKITSCNELEWQKFEKKSNFLEISLHINLAKLWRAQTRSRNGQKF